MVDKYFALSHVHALNVKSILVTQYYKLFLS